MSADPAWRERAGEPQAFPWQETLGFLMGVLGWPPDAAWRATPREVEFAIAGRLGRAPRAAMNGARLGELMARFPDKLAGCSPEETGECHGGRIS